MARNFVNSTSRLIPTNAWGAPGSVGTMSLWIKPNWSSGDSATHVFWIYYKDTAPTASFSFQKFSDNTVLIGWVDATNGDQRIVVADTGLFVSGVWSHHVFTWDDAANDCKYYVDGVQKGSRTSALVTVGGWNHSPVIGNYQSVIGNSNCDSHLARAAKWTTVLNSTERAALDRGARPRTIQRAALDLDLPLDGLLSPEPDYLYHDTWTISGTSPARSNDPPVTLFTPKYPSFTQDIAGGATNTPINVGTVTATATVSFSDIVAHVQSQTITGTASVTPSLKAAHVQSQTITGTASVSVLKNIGKAIAIAASSAVSVLKNIGKPVSITGTDSVSETHGFGHPLSVSITGTASVSATNTFQAAPPPSEGIVRWIRGAVKLFSWFKGFR